MKTIRKLLDGRKTHLVAVLIAVLTALLAQGIISKEQYELALGIMAALGLTALRAGVKKSGGAKE